MIDRQRPLGGEAELTDLLQRVAGGDRNAFAELYSRTGAQLLGNVVRMLQRRDVAEEILHDAFLRIWHNAPSFTAARGTPMSWMTAIVRNAALDRLRRQRREVALGDLPGYEDQADEAPDPFERMATTVEGRALARCLDELEAEQRGCLLLAYYHGLSHDELAQRLQRPLGTVKSWIRRSLTRLKRCLDP